MGAWPLADLRPQITFLLPNLRINLQRHFIQIALFGPLRLTEQPRVVFRQPMFSIKHLGALRNLSLAHYMVQPLQPLILSSNLRSSPVGKHLLALDPFALSSLPDPSNLGINYQCFPLVFLLSLLWCFVMIPEIGSKINLQLVNKYFFHGYYFEIHWGVFFYD